MSATNSFSKEPSDILDEQVDSSTILINRLESWRHAVAIVHGYAHQALHTQQQVSNGLAKQHKAVADQPSFSGGTLASSTTTSPRVPQTARFSGGPNAASSTGVPVVGGAPSISGVSATGTTGASVVASGTGSEINAAFQALAHQTDSLLRESEEIAGTVKQSIIPQLEALNGDLEKHHKTLRSQGNKLSRETEKHRETTMKHLEQLGRSVSIANSPSVKPEPKNDPYVLHRKVRGVAAEQIAKENQFSESNLNVQNNFASLEQHIIEVLQNSVASLNDLQQRYASLASQLSATTERRFSAIQPAQEWAHFKHANSAGLVPDTGFQRDPSRVTFANSDAESTVPIIEGTLNRKGVVFKGNKPGWFVLTQTGFLHQFKSSDYLQDSHPQLSLYIPESEIGGLPPPGSGGELSFKIVSRDSRKGLSPHHKYTFFASDYEDLVAWHNAIAQVAGASITSAVDDVEEDPGLNTESIYDGGVAGRVPSSPTTGPTHARTVSQPDYASQSGLGAAGIGGTAAAGGLVGGLAGGAVGAGAGGFGQQAVQHDTLPQGGLAQDASQLGGPGFQAGAPGYGAGGADYAGVSNLGGVAGGATGLSRNASQLGGAPQQFGNGLQQDASQLAGAPQQFQSNLSREASQLGRAPQQFQSGLQQDASQLAGAPQQFQSNIGGQGFGSGIGADAGAGLGGLGVAGVGAAELSRDGSRLGNAPRQFESGLQQDASQLAGAPQQFQSNLSREASQLGRAPQQFQSGIQQDASQLAGAPQQFQSNLSRETSQLGRVPQQQFQSNLSREASQLGRAPQQFQSGIQQDASQLGGAPQQFQSNLSREASQLGRAPQQFQSGVPNGTSGGFGQNAAGVAGAGGLGAAIGAAGAGAGGAGYDAANTSTGSGHAYNQFADDVGTQQHSSAYSTPQQQSQSRFPDQQQQATTPYSVSQRVEGLRLNDGAAPQQQYRTGPVGAGGIAPSSPGGYGNNIGGPGYQNSAPVQAQGAPRSPQYAQRSPQTQSGYAPRSPQTGYGSVPHSPTQAGTAAFAAGGVQRSPTLGGEQQAFQGSRTASGTSDRSAPNSVPHYKLSPTKRGTLQSDHVDGLGAGGTFGALPVNPAAESPAREALREHHEKVPEETVHHHHHHVHLHHHNKDKPEVLHKGYRHNPDDGLPGAHVPSQAAYASSTPTTPRYDSARPTTGAQQFTQTGYGSPRVAEEKTSPSVGNVRARDVEYSKPSAAAYPTVAAGTVNPLVGSPTSYSAPGASSPTTAAAGQNLNNITSRDVGYSHPKPSEFSTIAQGNTNPLLGSNTQQQRAGVAGAAGAAAGGSPGRYAGQTSPGRYAGQSSPGRHANANIGARIPAHDVAFSHPDPSKVSEIAASNTNPLLNSTTHYSAPVASGGSGSGYRDENLQSRATQQFASGSRSPGQKEPFTIVNTQDATQRGHARGPSFENLNRDTGSRLDPLSSRYVSSGAAGAAAGTVGGGAGGYGGQEFKDARGSFGSSSGQSPPGPGSTRVTGAGGNSYGTQGFQDAKGTSDFGDYSHRRTGSNQSYSGAGQAQQQYGGGSNGQYRPYSQAHHGPSSSLGSGANGNSLNGGAGGYSQKDYSNVGPTGGNAQYSQGPGAGYGNAQRSSGGGVQGGGNRLGAVAGGIGGAAGLAGMAGVSGAGEVSQGANEVQNLSSGNLKNAAINEIPGAGDVNEARNLASGNVNGALRQEIPGANDVSQLDNAAKDLKGGEQGAVRNAEREGLKEAEKAEKPSGFRKLANVFRS